MPLLGKKIFTLASNGLKDNAKDAPFMIPHTKERFQSKSEYNQRKELYAQNVWTCRATGHTNLTHEEACNSEKVVMDQLEASFPKCFEKNILELVHHSSDSLETLVDKAWLKFHQQFIIGEKVLLKVKVADKLIPTRIVNVETTSCDGKTSPACNSPSSDKENSADEKEKDKSSKKWVLPKFLPYNYSIELEKEAQVIHSVPATDLHRIEKVPSKDMLRHFIRVSALRSTSSTTSPWVVNEDLVKRYKLVSKYADFFLSPAKMSEAYKRAQENGKKRKLSNGMTSPVAKKLKLQKPSTTPKSDKTSGYDASSMNKSKSSSTPNLQCTPKKKSQVKKLSSPSKKKPEKNVISISDSDSEEKVSLSKLKRPNSRNPDSDSDVPLYQLVEQTTPKKVKKLSNITISSEDDVPLSKITPSTPKKSAKTEVNGNLNKASSPSKAARKKEQSKETSKKSEKSKESSKKLEQSKEASKKSEQSKDTAKKSEQSKEASKKSEQSKKATKKLGGSTKNRNKNLEKGGMKQVTLYELTKRGKLESNDTVQKVTPTKKSPAKASKPPAPPPMPPIVQRLLSCKRESMYDKLKYSNLLKKAISVLLPQHIKNLPEKLRDEIEHKKKFMEEKDKMAKMTPEQREEYLKDKREQAKKVQKQKILQKLRDKRRRFEDTDLQLTPLPQAKLVPTPDGFPNTLFGDVVMVTEFINCYSGLLMPDSEYPIYTDALMKALVGGSSGFAYESRVLTVLLHTFLQDHISKSYTELGTRLSDIAVSAFTASELVRLCLQCGDDEDEEEGVNDLPEECVTLLADSEFYQLEVEQKLSLLRSLCSRVLATDAVQDYMEEQQRKALELTKQKHTEMKQLAAQKKSGKQSGAAGSEDKNSKLARTSMGSDQDGEKELNNSLLNNEVNDSGEESNNLGSIVKRRRLLAAKAAAEKEKQEKERMAAREREFQEEKQKEKMRKKQEQITEAINLAKMVLRQDPIGSDRHHDRYWVFTNVTPGLYVEKGWMGDEVNYCSCSYVQVEKVENSSESESEVEEEEKDEEAKKVVYRARRYAIETTAPRPGQNLWFTYRSQKDLDVLLRSLHAQGIRESSLKAEIKKRYDDISRAIIQAQRTNLELRDSDGDAEMLAAFKKELTDMELRLRNGGLGGVPNFDNWEATLVETNEISVLGEHLLQVQDCILDKFLQGCMKPVVKSSESLDDCEKENKKQDGSGEDKLNEKEDKYEKAVKEWKAAVEKCQTLSRLHVLMAILDTCVKWEKSAENAKCKICRKKSDDAQLLLCDECNQAFHMYCLRPALSRLPSGDWFCPACKPRKLESRTTEQSGSEYEEEEAKDDSCRECGGQEKLVVCSKCPAAYHTQCHDPPLRHPPRGSWECSDCKNGVSRRKNGKLIRKATAKNVSRREASTSEDEEETEDDDDDEEEDDDEDADEEASFTRSHRGSKRQAVRREKGSSTTRSRQPARSRSNSQRNKSSVLTPPTQGSRRGPSELSLCEDILQKIMKHKSSWPFLEPVDKKLVPDYHALIKKPMDFQTMQKKCARLSYASPQEFIEDAALVFENAEAYNRTDSEVYTCMQEVEKAFKDTLHKLLPDWPYYRTVAEKEENSSGSEAGRRRSRNK